MQLAEVGWMDDKSAGFDGQTYKAIFIDEAGDERQIVRALQSAATHKLPQTERTKKVTILQSVTLNEREKL